MGQTISGKYIQKLIEKVLKNPFMEKYEDQVVCNNVALTGADKQHVRLCLLQRLLYHIKHSNQPMVYLLPNKDLFPHYETESIHFIHESQKHFTLQISRCVTIYQHDCFLLKPKTNYPAPLSGLAHATQARENSLVTSETS